MYLHQVRHHRRMIKEGFERILYGIIHFDPGTHPDQIDTVSYTPTADMLYEGDLSKPYFVDLPIAA